MNSTHHSLSPANLSVAVTYVEEKPTLRGNALILAKELQIRMVEPAKEQKNDILLIYTERGLQLQLRGNIQGILHVDFLSGTMAYRRLHGGGIKQPLARAIGIKPGKRPSILDATAGLGNDAFLLATLGCRVCMVERSPLLAALLKDGMKRAASDQEIHEIITTKLFLLQGDTRMILETMEEKPDTIYMDPMYPHRRKSALNKQEMRLIRCIVGADEDATELLHAALLQAKKRVVVKRPKGAPRINTQVPTHIISMKNSRYDVYMV
jgi:16S rRNA (guanine1516-N2)-methyltransferase